MKKNGDKAALECAIEYSIGLNHRIEESQYDMIRTLELWQESYPELCTYYQPGEVMGVIDEKG